MVTRVFTFLPPIELSSVYVQVSPCTVPCGTVVIAMPEIVNAVVRVRLVFGAVTQDVDAFTRPHWGCSLVLHTTENRPSNQSHLLLCVNFPPGPIAPGFSSPSVVQLPTKYLSRWFSGAGLGARRLLRRGSLKAKERNRGTADQPFDFVLHAHLLRYGGAMLSPVRRYDQTFAYSGCRDCGRLGVQPRGEPVRSLRISTWTESSVPERVTRKYVLTLKAPRPPAPSHRAKR